MLKRLDESDIGRVSATSTNLRDGILCQTMKSYPFSVSVPEEESVDRAAASPRCAGPPGSWSRSPGRAVGHPAGACALLDQRVRLAQGRGQAERPAAVHRPRSTGSTSTSSTSSHPTRHKRPLIMTYGWPGSVIELLDTIGPLTDPTTHGGTLEDAFHLVLPSLPGYGFSGELTELGWESARTARAWGGPDGSPRLQPLCRPGRRRGCPRHRLDGPPGGRGFGRLPPEPAHGGARHRRSTAQGIRTGTRSGRGARDVQAGRLRLLPRDGNEAKDDRLRPAGSHPSPWPPGCWTTTPTATTRSPARSSTASPGQSHTWTTSSTTSRCTG